MHTVLHTLYICMDVWMYRGETGTMQVHSKPCTLICVDVFKQKVLEYDI